MSGEINWKQKYIELKSKYRNSVDMAFRLGIEEGMKQGQLDNANQQLQQANADKQNAMGGGEQPGKPNNNGAPGTPDQGEAPDKSGAPSIQPGAVEPVQPAGTSPMADSEHPQGSELDQHIAKLEGMLSKSEVPMEDLKKSLEELRVMSENMKMNHELRKSAMAIPAIAKALHKPEFKFGVTAQHNLSSTAKAAVTMQHQIVSDVMEKWEAEEKKAGKDILSTLGIEGLVKKE